MSPELQARIVTFYDQAKDEQNIILRQILTYANEFPTEVVKLVHQQPLEDGANNLAVLYTALANDAGKWSDFFLAEAKRILLAAKASAEPRTVLNNLQEFALLDTPDFKHRGKLLELFKPELLSDKAVLRYYAIQILGDFVSQTDTATLSAMEQLLHDSNWRVRYYTYLNLLDFHLTRSRATISLLDKIRARLFNFTDIK